MQVLYTVVKYHSVNITKPIYYTVIQYIGTLYTVVKPPPKIDIEKPSAFKRYIKAEGFSRSIHGGGVK